MSAANHTVSGLERLQHLAVVKIHQNSKFCGNKYMVNTVDGDVLFTMEEDGGILAFLTRGHSRGFHMVAVDSLERKAFMIRRPPVFISDKLELKMGGQVVGIVRKVNTFMTPLFSINDADDVPVLRVKGDGLRYKFKLQTQDKTVIGSISKKFRGILAEMFTYDDDYEITFPADLDWRYKTAVIATCILIDYRYHEG